MDSCVQCQQMSLKNFHSQKLSKLISAPSPSHHNNCNTHSTTRINICSLILYLLLSLLQNKSLLFYQDFYFCVTFPIQYTLEHQAGSLWSPSLAALPATANTSPAAPGKVTAMGWPQELQSPPGQVCSLGKGTTPEWKVCPSQQSLARRPRQGKVWVSTTVHQKPFPGTVKARLGLLLPLQSLQWDSWLLNKRLLNKIHM